MNSVPLTKAQRREVRDLVGLIHERELAKAVGELQMEFERWRGGEIDVFELNDRIHKFHDGASRDLYKRYVLNRFHEMNVAAGILDGIIRESEVTPATLAYLEDLVASIRRAREQGGE